MNLHHLRIFYTVAQRRSITRAANELLLSQPAVSLQLKTLEKELGLPLFERGGPSLRLTQAGEVLYRAAVSILHAKDEAERAISELRGGSKGRLILGAGTTGGMYVLPHIVQAYKTLWPETEILFHIGTTDQILEKLQQNVLDMALVGGPVDDRRFVIESICAAARCNTSVPPFADSVRRSSPGGIAVDSVATRVSVTVCATPGTVSSRPNAAATAAKAGTPGTIS